MNFKKMLASIGLLAVAAPATLSVAACGTNRVPSKDLEQEIINAINGNTYETEILPIKTSVDSVNKIISGDFIKTVLTEELSSAFDNSLFKFNKITVDGDDLKSEHLVNPGRIEAQINYQYGNKDLEQVTNLIINLEVSDQQIVDAINAITDMKIEEKTGSTLEEIIARYLQTSIIEDHIKDEVVRNSFNAKKFEIVGVSNKDDTEFTDEDLKNPGTHELKIRYNYGSEENQAFNLLAEITQDARDLSNVFEHFSFSDSKDVKGFLDNNKFDNITQQIQEFLNLDNLEKAGLVLENQTSNSIILKANEDSDDYKGEVTLTWNLKLFEIWGARVGDTSDPDLIEGLKGYFYLDSDNEIKYFDVFWYKRPGHIIQVEGNVDYMSHSFKFLSANNEQLKDFNIYGKTYTNHISDEFDFLEFESDMQIKTSSRVSEKIKIFNGTEWIGLEKESELVINSMGEISLVS